MALVLVVDDEPSIPVMLRKTLERSEHLVLTASTPDEALALLAQHDVEVLLVDKNMPQLSGAELIRQAREKKAGIGVVLMTANPDLPLIRELKLDAYLPKPFRRLEDVNEAVLRALEACKRRLLTAELQAASRSLHEATKAV